ncbi:hypothetical protein OHA40_14080 [Nocardia sp. NBC_00508]|uniref:hypothetical protein n=1 Tax=Nocardia sp. NBC_00508 TaxID=2975992 RepID=UPI002E81252F|nr:hypothetical protein [Nocardia sp. NBC_00508]WUD69151.1 hypothetical protein OHA40_14080 [Nocardia sp. NBC_00508]
MTAMWFGLAAIALVGAIVLLYFDRLQRQRTGHARQVWAKSQGYTYVSVEPALPSTWRRGALAKLGYLSAVDVVSGIRKGEKFVLFDLEDAATLVAVRRQIGSDIDVDMRLKTAAPPKDHDLELLGAIGDRVVFATNPEIARHAVDQRMVAFIENLSDTVQMLWSEGNWTLGMLSVGTSPKDWENAIDAVLRLSGLLHVLPPVSEPRFDGGGHDPGRPRPRERQRDTEDDTAGGPARPRVRKEPESDERPFGEDVYSDDRAPLTAADESEPEPPRRPSLAVVPNTRARVREDDRADDDALRWEERGARPAAESWAEAAPETPQRPADPPGGPFHPGFRPYQGPVPK